MSNQSRKNFERKRKLVNARRAVNGERFGPKRRYIKDLNGWQRAAAKRWLIFYRRVLAEESSGLALPKPKPAAASTHSTKSVRNPKKPKA